MKQLLRAVVAFPLLALSGLALVPAASAGPEKVSPLLRKYSNPEVPGLLDVGRFQKEQMQLVDPAADGLHGTAQAEPRIRVIIHGDVTRESLEALGVTVDCQAGKDIFTGWMPGSAVPAVSDLPGMRRIEAARPVKPNLDVSAVDVNIRTEVHGANAPPYPGNTGANVVIGDVDSGFDYKHGDFRTAGGASRFHSIWDQTTGLTWNQASLDANTATTTDPAAHGTHVMGIAGGNGRATGPGQFTYVGMAPDAHLYGVKTTFSDADIIAGVDWIFDQATLAGQPAVVNLSLGGQAGPHDGTDPFEVGISNLTGAGKIVVCSAGNDRGAGIHAEGTVPASGSPTSLTFGYTINAYTAAPGAQNDVVLFSCWYESTENYTVTVTRPGGTFFTVARGLFQQQNGAGGAIQIDNGTATNTEGDYEVFIALFDASSAQPPAAGAWQIRFDRVTSTGAKIHAWNYSATMVAGFTTGVSDNSTVSTPGTANDVITVGAYTTKSSWTSTNGSNFQWSTCPCTYGSLADFSSRGPRRNGAQVPHVTAPGFGVAAAMSSNASPAIPTALIVPGNQHFMQAGTSMSAPHVAGLAALILNRPGNSGLLPSQVKSLIQGSARTDGFTGGVPNADWGYGKLDGKYADTIAPTVIVSTPNGGEVFTAGQNTNITWLASDAFGITGIDLLYSTDGGASYPNVIVTNTPNDGGHPWTVPAVSSTTVRVKAVAHDPVNNTGEDVSNANFTIQNPDVTPPSITVTAPNGGESFPPGYQAMITWNASDTGMNGLFSTAAINGVDSVRISYSLNAGANWILLASGEANDGTYTWSIPGTTTDSALVRIEAWDPTLNTAADQSNALFRIASLSSVGAIPPVLTLSQSRPNPLAQGTTHISFGVTREGPVTLRIFDAQGREVATLARGTFPAGAYDVAWDGRSVEGAVATSGIYFYRLETVEGTLNRKLMVIR